MARVRGPYPPSTASGSRCGSTDPFGKTRSKAAVGDRGTDAMNVLEGTITSSPALRRPIYLYARRIRRMASSPCWCRRHCRVPGGMRPVRARKPPPRCRLCSSFGGTRSTARRGGRRNGSLTRPDVEKRIFYFVFSHLSAFFACQFQESSVVAHVVRICRTVRDAKYQADGSR